MGEAAYLAVARFLKPHGLKGEALVVALTDDPLGVLVPERQLVPVDDAGTPVGPPMTLTRVRPYHGRQWLLAFEGLVDRAGVERWRDALLGVPAEDLTPLADGQMYVHEIPGTTVVSGETVIGVARELVETPQGKLLVVDGGEREHLIPFRRPIVVRVDRAARRIEIDPPAGLLEL